MKKGNFELKILVKDKAIYEYTHNNNVFVEGRKKSNFELHFYNDSYSKVLVIPSVDGVNTVEGTPASIQSKGYIVSGKTTLRIPGWTIDNNNVAKFVFQGKEGSYAQYVTPKSTNSGVIGVLVVAEQVEYYRSFTTYAPVNSGINNAYPMYPGYIQAQSFSSNSVGSSNMTRSADAASASGGSGFSLGTGFGKQSEFTTTEAPFKRGNLLEEMVIYYDDKRGLLAHGVNLTKQPVTSSLPKAFTTVGCPIPPGWKT